MSISNICVYEHICMNICIPDRFHIVFFFVSHLFLFSLFKQKKIDVEKHVLFHELPKMT